MHLIRIDTVSLDEGEAAVDLGQDTGDIVVLSFTDSDLFAIASAYRAETEAGDLPSLRLAKLARLRHPMSVDLYVEAVIAKARIVVIRCLGGLDYWRYGIERCHAAAKANSVKLVVLPGDDRPDSRLDAHSTLAPRVGAEIDAYFRAGGQDNLRQCLRRLAAEIGCPVEVKPPQALPRGFAWTPSGGAVPLETALAGIGQEPFALLLVYRSALLAGDTAPFAALIDALAARGIATLTLAVASLKDAEAASLVREAVAARRPDIVIAATAFSAREDAGFVLDRADCPILQAYTIGAAQAAWTASARGMNAADLAMQVALPEFDGRLAGFPISFKEEALEIAGFSERRATPYPDGIAALADRAASWIRLARLPRPERRIALVLSDYPARGGRAGYAVGLDTPESARAIVCDLVEAGFAGGALPKADELMRRLTKSEPCFVVPVDAYLAWFGALPPPLRDALLTRWGAPTADPHASDGAFRFRMVDTADAGDTSARGRIAVFLQPDRGRAADRKAGYHDPDEPPTHAYLAFHFGLRGRFDALIHLGTHGTTEWLPGKAVALSGDCWPARAVGALPVIYPFIVDDPGEAAPAKRRLGAIALGHLTPQVEEAGLSPEAAALRELVEEYSAASVLDPRRADLIARTILDEAGTLGMMPGAGISGDTPMADALTALDAHLCDLAETPFRDGLHVFGRATEAEGKKGPPHPHPHPEVPRSGLEGALQTPSSELEASFEARLRLAPQDEGVDGMNDMAVACALAERDGLIAALDGRFIQPGPAGSPSRGRKDVMPTGRNMTTLDPRSLPTRAATMLGNKAADSVVRRYLQDEGEYPARIVMDLWASPTLRTGGEDVAHALALMGVRPLWDNASTRVTGFEVLPLAMLDRPRIDVTCRVSGAFRDTFPDTLALLDQAARTVAAREEEDDENPLAASRRRGDSAARIFGAAPGRYGAGAGETALDGRWTGRDELGRAYLDASSFAYGRDGAEDSGFAERVAQADAYIHAFDVAERDLLDGDAAADAMGGFFAAASRTGASPALYSLDVSKPEAPKPRTAREDVRRLIRARLANPRWIAAQLCHGWRGAQEFAQGIDALFILAAATDAVTDADLDRLHAAWIGDLSTFEALRAANPDATRAILDRFEDLRVRGLWRSRRNTAPAEALMGDAVE